MNYATMIRDAEGNVTEDKRFFHPADAWDRRDELRREGKDAWIADTPRNVAYTTRPRGLLS